MAGSIESLHVPHSLDKDPGLGLSISVEWGEGYVTRSRASVFWEGWGVQKKKRKEKHCFHKICGRESSG